MQVVTAKHLLKLRGSRQFLPGTGGDCKGDCMERQERTLLIPLPRMFDRLANLIAKSSKAM